MDSNWIVVSEMAVINEDTLIATTLLLNGSLYCNSTAEFYCELIALN